MAPFTWQVLKWQQDIMQKQKVQAHIFFNDGDKTKDDLKELGNTGGIYVSHTHDIDSLVRLMHRVQANGNGGDIPENDIEVLLYAQENYPTATTYVLIADTQSSIRDFELLEKLNTPVKIILVRANGSVPMQYLKLALHTKGSLHTTDDDFDTREQLLQLKKYLDEKHRFYNDAKGDSKRRKTKKRKK